MEENPRLKISVVIPAWNEEKVIEDNLRDLAEAQRPDEILVADGGSADRTAELARRWARVIEAPKGRACQMNAGARAAAGDLLLFLHADTRLPARAIDLIRDAVAKGHAAGRFRMRFDRSDWLLRVYSSYTRFHFFSYGDQAFFVRRDLFTSLGGFREDVPFEDIDFYRRLRKVTRPVILPAPVVTSARRFYRTGSLRQKWINLLLVSLYYLGFDVLPLKARTYPDIR